MTHWRRGWGKIVVIDINYLWFYSNCNNDTVVRAGGGNLLDIEVQMAREFQFSSEDLLIDPKRIVVKEWWVPVERNEDHPQSTHTMSRRVNSEFVHCNNSMMQGTGKWGQELPRYHLDKFEQNGSGG